MTRHTFVRTMLHYGYEQAVERINMVEEHVRQGLPIDAGAIASEPKIEAPPSAEVKVSRLKLIQGDAP